MNENDITRFKARLEEEKQTLETELSTHAAQNPNNPADWDSKTPADPEGRADENELADHIDEEQTNRAVVDQLEIRLKNVSDALERIEAGTYGVCTKTGETIPVERLEANPAAATLVEHAE